MTPAEKGREIGRSRASTWQSKSSQSHAGLRLMQEGTSSGLGSVLSIHLGVGQRSGLSPVNASTMSAATGGEGDANIPEPPVLPGKIHQVYRRNHSRGAVGEASPCVCREPSKKNLGWEAQYIYEVDASALSDKERGMLYVHMYAIKEIKKYEKETPIHSRVIDEELWQVFRSGFSSPDPHWWNVPYPKHWKLETELSITMTAAFVENGFEWFYEIQKLNQKPSDKWKSQHGNARPNTEDGWETTNPGGQPTNVPAHRKAAGSSAKRVFTFNPQHPWFLSMGGIVILSPQDIEDGNVGSAVGPGDDPTVAVMNQWKPAGGTYREPPASTLDPRDPVDPPDPEGG